MPGQTVRLGFTLAEVLVTLGIIGVVAAMTMPALTANYRKNIVEQKLYTTYNILQNMILLSIVDNGEPYDWNLRNDDVEIFEKYFAPYLKIVEKCKRNAADGTSCDTTVRSISGNIVTSYSYKYILNNGVAIMFHPGMTIGDTRRRGTFVVDILSGPKEKFLGRNVFPFNLIVDKNKYFITASQDYPENSNFCKSSSVSLINDCKSGNTSAGYASGIHCTALIECNNWKIPKDYPVRF